MNTYVLNCTSEPVFFTMANTSKKLDWCKVRLGKDLNWWVTETSDNVNWDVDGLSIIDPRQSSHILETLEGLRPYGLDDSIVSKAFIVFSIDSRIGKDGIKLVRSDDSVFDAESQELFLLPDTLDEERSPHAEFLDHITKLQVKMLNDTFHFEQDLEIEDLEEQIREKYSNDYMEGRAIHSFIEIIDILEYVPAGYSLDDLDEDGGKKKDEEENYDEIEDIAEEEITEDDTMKWDEDEDSLDDDNYYDDDDDASFDDLDDDDEKY